LNKSTDLPKIGLALGAGASRGWSHIGVIKKLLREGIEPDIVCGTSVGAIIGLGSTRRDVLRFLSIRLPQSGFVDKERLNYFLHNYVAAGDMRIEDMPKKYAAVSTNLDTGREVWLTEGRLSRAVRASMALPGLFPAVRDDRRWLVDGGLVNPVPVTVCRALGADIVIAVNLNSGIIGKHNNGMRELAPRGNRNGLSKVKQQVIDYSNFIFPDGNDREEAPGLFYAIANSVNIVQDRITRSRLVGDPADVLLSPRLARIGMLEFHRAAEAMEEGESCVQRALAEIRQVTGK